MTNMLIPNAPPAGVTYLRTRSKKPPEKSYDLFDLTFPGISLCYPCIIVLWQRESKASACFQVYLAGSPAYHRKLLWISLYEKPPFDFNAVKALQGQVLKSFLRSNPSWKVRPILLLEGLLYGLVAKLEQPHTGAEQLARPRPGGGSRQGPVSLCPWLLRCVQEYEDRRSQTVSVFAISQQASTVYLLEDDICSGHWEYQVAKSCF